MNANQEIQKAVESIFKGLSNEGSIMNNYKSGRVLSSNKCGTFHATIADVAASFSPWSKVPTYYACKKFLAFISFLDITSTEKGIKHYNSLNDDKIMKFNSINDLVKFIS